MGRPPVVGRMSPHSSHAFLAQCPPVCGTLTVVLHGWKCSVVIDDNMKTRNNDGIVSNMGKKKEVLAIVHT